MFLCATSHGGKRKEGKRENAGTEQLGKGPTEKLARTKS